MIQEAPRVFVRPDLKPSSTPKPLALPDGSIVYFSSQSYRLVSYLSDADSASPIRLTELLEFLHPENQSFPSESLRRFERTREAVNRKLHSALSPFWIAGKVHEFEQEKPEWAVYMSETQATHDELLAQRDFWIQIRESLRDDRRKTGQQKIPESGEPNGGKTARNLLPDKPDWSVCYTMLPDGKKASAKLSPNERLLLVMARPIDGFQPTREGVIFKLERAGKGDFDFVDTLASLNEKLYPLGCQLRVSPTTDHMRIVELIPGDDGSDSVPSAEPPRQQKG